MVILPIKGQRRLSTNPTTPGPARRQKFARARSVRGVALGMLLSFCISGAALGQEEDEEEDAAKTKPALPNFGKR